MNKFPAAIVQAIRRLVPRPKPSVFKLTYDGFRCLEGKCPMGMLPYAKKLAPFSRYDFKGPGAPSWPDKDIRDFAKSWDYMDDAKKAVLAVWGPPKLRVADKRRKES